MATERYVVTSRDGIWIHGNLYQNGHEFYFDPRFAKYLLYTGQIVPYDKYVEPSLGVLRDDDIVVLYRGNTENILDVGEIKTLFAPLFPPCGGGNTSPSGMLDFSNQNNSGLIAAIL